MADWVHCNTCCRQPGDGRKFCLTSCGHIYCNDCVQAGTQERCKMCGVPCTTITLSAKMKPDVEMFFTDPAEIVKKQQKQLLQVLDFQKGHRQRLTTFTRDKVAKQTSLVQKAQKSMIQMKDLEREILVLKEENAYLKKLIGSMGGPAAGRTPPSSSNIASLMHLGSPNSQHNSGSSPQQQTSKSPFSHGMLPNHTESKSPYYQDGVVISSSGQVRTPNGPPRITMRTPPSNGRIGSIRGTPSPQETHKGGHTPANIESSSTQCSGTCAQASRTYSPMAVSPGLPLRKASGLTPGIPLSQSGSQIPSTPTRATLALFGSPQNSQMHSLMSKTSSQSSQSQLTSYGRKPIQLNCTGQLQQSRIPNLIGGMHGACVMRIRQLKIDNATLQKNLQRLQGGHVQDKDKLNEAHEEIKVLKKLLDCEPKEKEMKELHDEIQIKTKKSEKLNQQVAALTGQLSRLKSEKELLVLQLNQSQVEVEQLSEKLSRTSSETHQTQRADGGATNSQCEQKEVNNNVYQGSSPMDHVFVDDNTLSQAGEPSPKIVLLQVQIASSKGQDQSKRQTQDMKQENTGHAVLENKVIEKKTTDYMTISKQNKCLEDSSRAENLKESLHSKKDTEDMAPSTASTCTQEEESTKLNIHNILSGAGHLNNGHSSLTGSITRTVTSSAEPCTAKTRQVQHEGNVTECTTPISHTPIPCMPCIDVSSKCDSDSDDGMDVQLGPVGTPACLILVTPGKHPSMVTPRRRQGKKRHLWSSPPSKQYKTPGTDWLDKAAIPQPARCQKIPTRNHTKPLGKKLSRHHGKGKCSFWADLHQRMVTNHED